MPSNVTLNSGSGGAAAVTAQITHDGDTAQLQGVFVMGISGTEDSYTAAKINGDATNGLDVDVTRLDPGTGATSLGKAEDAAAASGDVGVAALAVRRDTPAVGSGTDGDYSTINVDSSGRVYVNIHDGGNTITVDGTVGVSGTVTVDSELPTAAALADNTANPTVPAVGSFSMVFDGTTWDRAPGTSADGLLVNLGANNDVTVTGTVTANLAPGTNNIGDVDVLSVVPGTGATNLGKAIDSAAGATDTGIAPLAIRDDSLSALTPAEGDWVPLRVNSTGALHVTGGGGGTQYAVDTAAGGTDTGTLALAVRDDALTTLTPVDGDYVPLRVTSTGALHVSVTEGGVTGRAEDSAHSTGQEGLVMLAVRRDAASSGVDTDGDYATLSVTSDGSLRVSGAGGGTQYNVDTAAGATDTGTLLLAIRDDSLSTLTPVDGDYVGLRVSSTGALHVTGGGGGTEYTVDVAAPAAPTGATFVMERDDALSSLTEVEGDWTNPRSNANGAMWVAVDGTVTVGSHAVTNAGTFAVQVDGAALTALQLIDNPVAVLGTATYTEATTSGFIMGAVRRDADTTLVDTTNEIAPLQVDANGRLKVEVFSGETLPVSGTVTVNLAAGTNTNEVVGDAAHDAAIAGNPVRIAGRALTASYTAVATGDTADLITTTIGQLVTIPYSIPENTWSYAAASGGITNTTGVTAVAAAGAGLRRYITRVQVVNGHATVSTDVQIRDGASGTVLWRGFAQAAGGGVSAQFDPPLRGSANTLVEVACGTTGSATYFNLQGYTAP